MEGKVETIRASMPKLPARERAASFDEVEKGLPEDIAVLEAIRCLGCNVELCVGCRICAEVCPDACIHINTAETLSGKQYVTSYEVDSATCMFCGLCTEACPTKTLVHTAAYELSVYDKQEMVYRESVPAAKKAGGEKEK
ncbi:MAG: 4Fe-4S dicluster domain-containing protein [Candidatus Eremiobacteraeota bacterium]|nr:4Fe-4S dicluster domain-containing protein [Candidatus Eremiobacteraeota bacterium]